MQRLEVSGAVWPIYGSLGFGQSSWACAFQVMSELPKHPVTLSLFKKNERCKIKPSSTESTEDLHQTENEEK